MPLLPYRKSVPIVLRITVKEHLRYLYFCPWLLFMELLELAPHYLSKPGTTFIRSVVKFSMIPTDRVYFELSTPLHNAHHFFKYLRDDLKIPIGSRHDGHLTIRNGDIKAFVLQREEFGKSLDIQLLFF